MTELQEDVRAVIEKEYRERYEAWKAKDLADLEERQNKQITIEVGKLYAKIKDEQKPPTKEEIQLLVDQEYAEIKIKLPLVNDAGATEIKEFTLRELPQSVERKFYRQFQTRLKEKGTELAAFGQKNMDVPFEKMVNSFMETFDGAFDVLADAVATILNPYDKDKTITPKWAAENISSNRMYSIVMAQVEVNRLRDFFSRLFQSGQKVETILTPLNMSRLRQLAR